MDTPKRNYKRGTLPNQIEFDPSRALSTAGNNGDLYRGKLHLALHPDGPPTQDTDVALKRMRWGIYDKDTRFESIIKETYVWMVLDHPNLLQFLGILHEEDDMYLVAPFAPHGTLPEYIVAQPYADRRLFLWQIAAGMAYLHSRDIVHGDVKGANILVFDGPTAKICDFGLAKFADGKQTANPQYSLPWTSPERLQGQPRSCASDTYAFGMTIYEILSGQTPFHMLDSFAKLVKAVCENGMRPPTHPESCCAGVSYSLVWRVAKLCWHEAPDKRPGMNDVVGLLALAGAGAVAEGNVQDIPCLSIPSHSSDTMALRRKRMDSAETTQVIESSRSATRKKMYLDESPDYEMSEPASILTSSSCSEIKPLQVNKLARDGVPMHLSAINQLSTQTRASGIITRRQNNIYDIWGNVFNSIDIGLRAISHSADLIRGPGGETVKLMGVTSLSIIHLLNGMSNNCEEALILGRHVGVLVQTVACFLEAAVADGEVENRLSAFLITLQSMESSMKLLQSQNGVEIDFSRGSYKAYCQKWNIEVTQIFAELQHRLYLNSLRYLTRFRGTDSLAERLRMLDCLGDGATGVASKANEQVDLMCYPETRTVVLDDIDRWLKDPFGERILWISGVAGCGKSAVIATIPHQHQTSTSTAIFYFNRGTQEHNQRVICSLSRQIARLGHGTLECVVLEAVGTQPDISTSLLATQFQKLLVNPLKKLVPGSSPVLILIDGLDEWDNQAAASKLVELIGRAHIELPAIIRFVVASRNEYHLVSSMQTATLSLLVKRYELDKVPPNDALHDVRVYLETRFSFIRSESTDPMISSDNWPGENSITVLVNLSAGLFQWASTVMKHIEQRLPHIRLRRILDAPEEFRGLDGLYGGILKSSLVDDTSPLTLRLLQKVLGFIVLAPIPVNTFTITYYCADPSRGETLEVVREEVLARLASFLILPKDPFEPIRVSHKSIVDFATDPDRCVDRHFYIHAVHHQRRLAITSLTLLTQDKSNIDQIGNRKFTNEEFRETGLDKKRIPPALRYACLHWATHLSLAGHADAAELIKLLDQFASNSLMYWLEVISLCGFLSSAGRIIQEALAWRSSLTTPFPLDVTTQHLLTDIAHFLNMFEIPITERACLVSACALPLALPDSELWRRYSDTAPKGLRVVRGPHYTPTTKSFWVGKHFPSIVSVSSNRNMLTSPAENDSDIVLWDGVSGEQRGKSLKGHAEAVRYLAFAPDGKTLASVSVERSIRIWDTAVGSQKWQALDVGEESAQCVAFSPDGRVIASGLESGGLWVWALKEFANAERTFRLDVETTLEDKLQERRIPSSINFSPEGTRIGHLSSNGAFRSWDVDAGGNLREAWSPRTAVVTAFAFSHDAKLLAFGDADGITVLWDVNTRKPGEVALGNHASLVHRLQFSADSRIIAVGLSEGWIQLWELNSRTGGQRGEILKGYAGRASDIAFSYGPRMFAPDPVELVWDLDTEVQREEPVLKGHMSLVACLAFSSDGQTLASGSIDGTICLWDVNLGVQTGQITSPHSGLPMNLQFAENDRKLIAYHGMRDPELKGTALWRWLVARIPLTDTRQSGEIGSDGWVLYNQQHWFWLPVSGGAWLLLGTCLAVRTGLSVFIFDVSNIMDLIS